MLCLAIAAARSRGTITEGRERELVKVLTELPRLLVTTLREEEHITELARNLINAQDVLYLGRGANFPIALEGALKLKEISYIHAEGYAAGELKHGPIALIDETVPVIVIAPKDALYDKVVSNMQEVAARGGQIILLTDDIEAAKNHPGLQGVVQVPQADPVISPILFALPVQLLAYHAAVFMGTDVDQPRNLAKSVTVE